jgi:hypothetical protein
MDKGLIPRLLIFGAAFAGYLIWRSMPGDADNVTVRGIVISLPNADAVQFSSQHDLAAQPGAALAALESLVASKKAIALANPTITTKSGERAVSDSGDGAILEAQPIIEKGRKTAEVRLAVVEQGHRIVTSIQIENGGTRFLGTIQNPSDNTRTDYVFVRVSF